MSKRTLESFYRPVTPPKRVKTENPESLSFTRHPSYPHPIAELPSSIAKPLANINLTSQPPQKITNRPHLDLLYFHPLIPSPTARDLFNFLRRELPFYRVQYTVRRGGTTPTQINTPRFTTVFGVDATSQFVTIPPFPADEAKASPGTTTTETRSPIQAETLVDANTRQPIPESKYQYTPRPIPPCLNALRQTVEAAINDGSTYNFVLVNYYATGDDSISYHSDDERFLGVNPCIASLSLGAQRDFYMKHKPVSSDESQSQAQGRSSGDRSEPLKFALASGDMVVMRGETQANWLHTVPKRKGGEARRGRINITFRKAVVPGGTNNYYNYNVGSGTVYRWDEKEEKMCPMS